MSLKTQKLVLQPFSTQRNYLHLLNSVRDTPGVYSCAIDSFLELMFYCVFNSIKEFDAVSPTIQRVLFSCQQYEILLRNHIEMPFDVNYELLQFQVRETIWDFLCEKCPSFRPRDCNAVFSDIFREQVFSDLNDLEKLALITTLNFNEVCSICNSTCIGFVNTFVQYVSNTDPNYITDWPDMLFQTNFSIQSVTCNLCGNGVNIGEYFVNPAHILFVEMDESVRESVFIHEIILIRGMKYKLKGVVRNTGAHFSTGVQTEYGWVYLDDLIKNVEFFTSFANLKEIKHGGWFFCCYVKECDLPVPYLNSMEALVDHNYLVKSSSHIMPKHDMDIQEKENSALESNNIHFNIEKSTKTFNFSEPEPNCCNFITKVKFQKQACLKVKQEFEKTDKPSKKRKTNDFFSSENRSLSISFSKESYKLMKKFYDKLKCLKIYQCEICKEAWPQSTAFKICGRCKRDKTLPKKFSIENKMIPSSVPSELSNLSQVEEMLIARALPFMNIYCKPKGGQRGYKGHVITFPTDVQHVANVLPNLLQDLPLVSIGNSEKYKSKEFRVRRSKVLDALKWLVHNNSLYSDIVIDESRVFELPVDDLVDNFVSVEGDLSESEVFEEPNACDIEERSSFILASINKKTQRNLIREHINSSVELDIIGENPINEFRVSHLGALAFPTLFPDGRGDPTDLTTVRDIASSETQSFAMKIAHLLKFSEKIDGDWVYRFASHPRFAYWAYNMLFRRRLLAKGNVYVKQHPEDFDLTIEEFNELLSNPSSPTANNMMSKIFYYTKEIPGTNSYWCKIRQDLKALVKQEGVPTIFFTLSMAENYWPDLLSLFNCSGEDISEVRKKILENPHLVDWYFTTRTEKFVKIWLYEHLRASWHWFRYEYASRGTIHCHGLAKLSDDPDLINLTSVALKGYLSRLFLKNKSEDLSNDAIEQFQKDIEIGEKAESEVCNYIDKLVSALNPCDSETWTKPSKHPCKLSLTDVKDLDADFENLINSTQKHVCSAYCLRDKGKGLECRFNYPFECSSQTRIEFSKINTKDGSIKYRAEIILARNDTRLNRTQRVQLQGWRANCDLSVIIDYHTCLEYLTKYAAKAEKLSSVVSEAFSNISFVQDSEEYDPIKLVKKVMMQTVGFRDMSIQEVCHSILSLKLFSCSFNIITISLNGARQIDNVEGDIVVKPSLIDIYAKRSDYSNDDNVINSNFVSFHSNYFMRGDKISKRNKRVVIRIVPCYPSIPSSEKYGLYCKFSLLKYKVWSSSPNSAWNCLEDTDENYISCWHDFVRSDEGKIIPNYATELENIEASCCYQVEVDSEDECDINVEEREEWMYISDMMRNHDDEPNVPFQNDIEFWREQCSEHDQTSVLEMPTWLNLQKNTFQIETGSISNDDANVKLLNTEQKTAFELVRSHMKNNDQSQLLLLVVGKAGCGKSFLIDRLRHLLGRKCLVSALFGLAAYNVSGKTLHHILKLPIKGKRNSELDGSQLMEMQENLRNIRYLIIDEYSVVSQKDLAWISRRCKQATGINDKVFGGINIILLGDLGQLPPVKGNILFHKNPKDELSAEGLFVYSEFKKVVVLNVNQRVSGLGQTYERFKELLCRIRDGCSTHDDWELLLTRTLARVKDAHYFSDAIKLSFGNKKVAEDNFEALKKLKAPIARIDARHNKKSAARLSADDMGGLQKTLYLALDARVMLLRNIWTEVGLCNGALGTVHQIIYAENQCPPSLPVAILVKFDDSYKGPSYSQKIPNLVPIPPCTSSSESLGKSYERTHFPLKLAWAITIHKSQGLTLEKASIDLGKSERSSGLSYVALSRVRNLDSFVIEPMSFERLSSIGRSTLMDDRKAEEKRLENLTE